MSEAIKQEMRPGEDLAYSTALKDLDPSNSLLWPKEEFWPIFDRLRNEAPLHYCPSGWQSEDRTNDAPPIGG